LREDAGEVRKSERPIIKKSRRYTDGALEEAQLRVTDFLPRKGWKLSVLLAAGLILILVLELFYRWQAGSALAASRGIAPPFDLAAAGSVGAWFASLTLLGCSAVALIVYNLRRHRIADYRGRYRFWLWAAAVFGIASVCMTARIDQSMAALMFTVTGGHVISTVPVWVFVGWTAVGLSVAVPLLLELRMSRTTIAGLLAAGVCYAGAGLLSIGVFRGHTLVGHVSLQVGLLYVGHVLTLTSLWAFARLVFLDAQGQLIRKRRKSPPEITPPQWVTAWRQRQAANRGGKHGAAAANQKKPPAAGQPPLTKIRFKRPASAQVQQVDYEAEDAIDPQVLDNPDLTKAERRKLRKQLKQQRRRAA
jgi:hypothetical protein